MFNQTEDEVFKLINEKSAKDRAIALEASKEISSMLYGKLEEEGDFDIKHCFLALATSILSVSQALCKDEEQYNFEIEKAEKIASDRLGSSIMPLMQDGKIVEENFDVEDLKTSRIMMALGIFVDYILWKAEFREYATIREEVDLKDQETLKEEVSND